MILLLLLLSLTGDGQTQRFDGQTSADSCQCAINSSVWSFPVLRFEAADTLLQSCKDSLRDMQGQVDISDVRFPGIMKLFQNLTARLEPLRYLSTMGLYTKLHLRELGQDLDELENDIGSIHAEKQTAQTLKLTQELSKVQKEVERMHISDIFNLQTVKEKVRTLKNGLESCKSIPKDFISKQGVCSQALLSSISKPTVTMTSPYGGKSYKSGAWGRQARRSSPEEESKDYYWVQALVSSSAWGNIFYRYSSYQDFIAAANPVYVTVASSYSHTNAIEGPGSVLYGQAVYYHCYQSSQLCRYHMDDKTTTRLTLPGVGHNNKFPYCYYSCHSYSDIDLAVDETGLWAIYATVANHGNLVLSRLDDKHFNVTHTWTTQLFKRAVTNTFMACGVLYATRYVDDGTEEVFFAFDTATGQHDYTLSLPLEKVSAGVASLSYNPVDRKIYMYNDAYLLAYQAQF